MSGSNPGIGVEVLPTDKYEVNSIIYSRPEAIAVFAWDRSTEKEVFIKAKGVGPYSEQGERLFREAGVLDDLDHPQIPNLIDYGYAGNTDTPYLVTDRAPSHPAWWRNLVYKSGPLDVARFCLSALTPLAYLHDKGKIHRDVKGANFATRLDWLASLLDFELAVDAKPSTEVLYAGVTVHLGQPHPDRITDNDMVAGTVGYVSPERMAGKYGDKTCDVYGMGILMYELMYGKHPYIVGPVADGEVNLDRKSETELVNASKLQYTQNINFADVLDRDMPEELMEIIAKAAQVNPKYRYHDAADMRESIERFVRDNTSAECRLAS
jgi:serine/threonine protein kinase